MLLSMYVIYAVLIYVISYRINVLSVACGMEHTLALCSDGVRPTDPLFIDPDHLLQRRPELRIQQKFKFVF